MPMWLTQPVHRQLGGFDGTMTACGLRAIQHRPIRYSSEGTVTCKPCNRWIAKHPELFAKNVTP